MQHMLTSKTIPFTGTHIPYKLKERVRDRKSECDFEVVFRAVIIHLWCHLQVNDNGNDNDGNVDDDTILYGMIICEHEILP